MPWFGYWVRSWLWHCVGYGAWSLVGSWASPGSSTGLSKGVSSKNFLIVCMGDLRLPNIYIGSI